MLLDLFFPWHCSKRPAKSVAWNLPCPILIPTYHLGITRKPTWAQLQYCKCPEIDPTQKVLAVKALAGLHLHWILLSQAHKDWASGIALPPQSSDIQSLSLLDACRRPAPVLKISRNSSYAERASTESCCLALIFPWSRFLKAHNDWGSGIALPPQSFSICVGALPDARSSPNVQLAPKQTVIALKAFSGPHLSLALH